MGLTGISLGTGLTGVGSLGAVLASATAGATSPFDGVTMDLGSVQMSCEGVTGL
jgi:hypothetical protein